MNSKQQVKGKLGHVVQISRLPFYLNVMLNLSYMLFLAGLFFPKT